MALTPGDGVVVVVVDALAPVDAVGELGAVACDHAVSDDVAKATASASLRVGFIGSPFRARAAKWPALACDCRAPAAFEPGLEPVGAGGGRPAAGLSAPESARNPIAREPLRPKLLQYAVRRIPVVVALVLASAGIGGCAPAMAPIDPAARSAYDPGLVAQGAALAALGNCRACHTARNGQAFAGGEPMHSRFGTIYSTNITPDPETGIGRWSEEAFRRAMRKGLRNDGDHLYPAFPYDHFTRVTDEDIHALYAYFMSLPPVSSTPPHNALAFPFNLRIGNALWKRLYLHEGPRPPDPAKDATLARGEYLVEGLAHCGACHTPRNFLQAEKRDRAYDGGDLEGWHGYAINAKNAAPIPWEREALASYLRNGYHPWHGASRGTMGIVTRELANAPEADVNAMAAYAASLMGPADPARRSRGRALAPFGGVPLAYSLGLNGESPRNLINVIVHGLDPAPGDTSPMMPGYAGALNDGEIEALVQWLRENLTDKPRWDGVAALIRESRAMNADMLLFPPGGTGADPAAQPARN